jgi:lipoprotein NlpD
MIALHHTVYDLNRNLLIDQNWRWQLFNTGRYVLYSLFVIFVLMLCHGCGTGLAPVEERSAYAPAPAGFYRIRDGDTLYSIARRYKTSYQQLARWNRLQEPYAIYAGGLLRIKSPPPAATNRTAVAPQRQQSITRNARSSTPNQTRNVPAQVETTSAVPEQKRDASGIAWQWPLTGDVVQTFHAADRTRQGLRIAASPGTLVRAAATGTVVYSGSGLKGYGNLIIVKHNEHYLSAYGFNRRLIAREGERVKAGQVLAEVGQAANGDYLLHFEIRQNGSAVDPRRYLPRAR